MRKVTKMVSGLLVFLVLIAAGWVWVTLKFAYSTGERAGYVQKFSRKGWMFKTWEGELAMVNVPGAMQERFAFTVRNGEVAEKLSHTLGNRVILQYEQHKFLPTNAFGETEYFVVNVRAVGEDAAAVPPAPAVR